MKRTVTPIAATADAHGGDLGLVAEKRERLSTRRTPCLTGDPLTTPIDLL